MQLVVVQDGSPALRLLVWGLQEEGYTVATCAPAAIAECVSGLETPALLALVNIACEVADKRAHIASVRAAGVARVLDLCASGDEDCGADASIESPYKLISIVDAIKTIAAQP